MSLVTCRLAQSFLCHMKTTNKAAQTAKRYFNTRVTINWFSYFINFWFPWGHIFSRNVACVRLSLEQK